MDWMPVPMLGGVNLFDDPRAIRDDEVQLARNLVPTKPGILKKRGGLARPIRLFGISEVPSSIVMSTVPGSRVDFVAAIRETANGFPLSIIGIPMSGTLFSNSPPFDHPRVPMLSWGNGVYILPGPHAEWMVGSFPSSSSGPSRFPFYLYDLTAEGAGALRGVPFQGTGNENVFPTLAFPYKTRLVLANFGKGYENTIAFTDDYTADVVGDDLLASTGRAISLVAGADGDEIVGGIEVMLTNVGSPAESGLLILRRYGDPFLLTGDMDQSDLTGETTLDIKRVSVRTGCAGQHTVVRTPVGIIWAGADDVWCFAAGVLPHRLGQKIQPALKITPAQLQYRWSAAYFDGFYRLAVFGEGRPMGKTNAPGDQWWLDLREGLPQDWREARWWGPQQFLGGATPGGAPLPQTFDMVAEQRAGKDSKLYYVDYTNTTGASMGPVVGEYATNTRDTTSPAATIAGADYVDPEITSELVTKEYALSPARDQINDGLMCSLRPSNDLTLSTDFVIDDGDQVSARTKYLAGPSTFRLDSSTLDTSSSPITGKAIKTALYPQIRRAGQTHRFRVYDTAGHTIVQGFNDTLVVQVLDDSSGSESYQWVATVPAGAYTISDLLAALVVQINAGVLFADPWVGGLNSGIVTLESSNGTNITIVIAFVSVTPEFGITPTPAQLSSCRRLAAILGYDSGGNSVVSASSTNPTLDGVVAPFQKGISDWEIYGVAVNMEVLPRTP